MKHARKIVVTASLDALNFLAPVKVGEIVHIWAQVNYVSRTSMEVGVRVESEHPITGERAHTASAYTTFVALDKNGTPSPVPGLDPKSKDEKRRYIQAQKRRQSRVALAQAILDES
jgi:acyl-CoA hydrolase